ncbi:hypothetical protein [Streptosporangium sp. NPDC049644]|uniref:hypothetical protein n=1 Tax=Streptosporangium sp. NPDC049644 TaxID=3155507 RepID=UPI00342E1EF1
MPLAAVFAVPVVLDISASTWMVLLGVVMMLAVLLAAVVLAIAVWARPIVRRPYGGPE